MSKETTLKRYHRFLYESAKREIETMSERVDLETGMYETVEESSPDEEI